MKNTILLSLTLFLLSAVNSIYAETAVSEPRENEKHLIIKDAWIAEAPPVSKVMVAYLTLKNTGTETINIIRAEAKVYSSIEFHETIHENGMARMIRHDNLKVLANSQLELKRGGPHLMLFNPTKRLKAGDTVSIKLTTKGGKVKTIIVPVKKSHYN